jgi:hypothetical protein
LSAIDPYVEEVIVVDVPVTLVLVPSNEEPAELYIFTVNEAALTFVAHDTLTDFRVDDVAVAVTEDGAASVTGGADTETAVEELVVVPLPNSPYVFLPQHFTVVSDSTAHVW